jgi:TorA maturation chaperone TorD
MYCTRTCAETYINEKIIDGTFAVTANFNYRKLFVDQKKNKVPFYISVCSKQIQTEVCRFRFRLQQTYGSCHFPLRFPHIYIIYTHRWAVN